MRGHVSGLAPRCRRCGNALRVHGGSTVTCDGCGTVALTADLEWR